MEAVCCRLPIQAKAVSWRTVIRTGFHIIFPAPVMPITDLETINEPKGVWGKPTRSPLRPTCPLPNLLSLALPPGPTPQHPISQSTRLKRLPSPPLHLLTSIVPSLNDLNLILKAMDLPHNGQTTSLDRSNLPPLSRTPAPMYLPVLPLENTPIPSPIAIHRVGTVDYPSLARSFEPYKRCTTSTASAVR